MSIFEQNSTAYILILLTLVLTLLYYYFNFNDTDVINNVINTVIDEIPSQKINISDEYLDNPKYNNYTIIDFLKLMAKDHPRKIALQIKDGKIKEGQKGNKKIKWKSVDYITYYKNVVGFSQSLNYWLGNNVNVAIIGFNSPGWFYSHLGCMMNGGTSIGMYPTSTKSMCKYILDNSKAQVLVVEDDTQLEKFVGMKMTHIQLIIYYSPISDKMINKFSMPVLSMGNFMSEKNTSLSLKPKFTDVATLIYTSGTTSEPKGVVLTHKNIITSVRRTLSMLQTKSSIKNFSQEDFISYLPLNHITAQFLDIYIPILTLGRVWFADKNALKTTLIETLQEVKPTCFAGVPRVWEKIHEQILNKIESENVITNTIGKITFTLAPTQILKKIGLDKCKYAVSAGAPLLHNTYNFFNSLGLEIHNIYGLSETSGPVSISVPGFTKSGSVGYPIMAIKISNDNEIYVTGDNLFSEYNNNKKATKDSFTNDKTWFKTGDLGMLDSDGFLYITGRKKDIIVTSGGENISPIPIENKLSDQLSRYFDHILVVGDKLKFLSVILAGTKKLPVDINKLILNAIDNTNKYSPSNASKIQKFLIINEKFTVGNELTPTMKIKRQYVQKKYNSRIMELYR